MKPARLTAIRLSAYLFAPFKPSALTTPLAGLLPVFRPARFHSPKEMADSKINHEIIKTRFPGAGPPL